MKRINRLTALALSSLLVLLGFGGCKSARRAVKQESQAARDSLRNGTTGPVQMRPDDPTRMRLLYGPPPTRYRTPPEESK